MTDVYTHPEYQAFLSAIRAKPDDDLPRLVIADWLDEKGDGERAELIRIQCDPLYAEPCGQVTHPLEDMPDLDVPCMPFHLPANDPDPDACPQCKLRHRVGQIVSRWDDDETVRHPFTGNGWTGYVVKTYDRGFLHTVRGPLARLVGGECQGCDGVGDDAGRMDRYTVCPDCSGTGRTVGVLPELYRREPLAKVVATDREPWSDGVQEFTPDPYGWCWWREAEWDGRGGANNQVGNLPDSLIDLMADLYPDSRMTWSGPRDNQHLGFPTPDAAREALSAALIRWCQSHSEVRA